MLEIHRQRGVGAVIADLQHRLRGDCRLCNALCGKLGGDALVQCRNQVLDGGAGLFGKRFEQSLLARGKNRRQPDAVSRKQAGEGVDENRFHAERVGDQAGMLAASAAETVQEIFGDIVAALHRDLLDGVGHVLDGDGDKALGRRFRRASVADLGSQSGEFLAHGGDIEWLILAGTEDRREDIGLQLAEHHIGVGNGERPATSVGGGARIGAGGVRADAETAGLVMQDRATACCDRMDAHHRCADAHAGDFGVEGPLVVAVIMGDVGRGAAHVEADDLVEACELRRLDHADDAAGRAGQKGILALEHVGGGQPA